MCSDLANILPRNLTARALIKLLILTSYLHLFMCFIMCGEKVHTAE